MLHFCEYWDIRVAGAPKATLSVPYLLSNMPLMRTLEPLFCTFCGYSGYTSHLKPLSLCTRLVEPFTTNKADRAFMLHFVWILWTYQSLEATTYCSISDLLHNLPQLWQIKPLSCTFCWLLRHTGRLKPLSLCSRFLKQYTTIKVLRASILHFLWLLWTCQSSEATISPYPTC